MEKIWPALLALLLGAACGTHQAAGPTTAATAADVLGPEIQSNDILAREPTTDRADVKHILIGWGALAPAYQGDMDPRGLKRTRAEADALAVDILKQVRGGAPIEPLMAELSEDPGSAVDGSSYPVTADANLVPEFKRLSLRLNVGEAGLVMTAYGWHIIQRVK